MTLASPERSVTAIGLDNVALAPDEGGVNITVIPGTGLPFESVTVACRAVLKFIPTCADCGVPAVAATVAGGPTACKASAKSAKTTKESSSAGA
jgi:hypothetical protein